MKTTDFYDIEPKHPIDEKIVERLQNEYKSVFKTRAKELDFKKTSCVNKHMMLMHKALFGENIINSEETGKVKLGNKWARVYRYTINMDTAQYHENIIEFSRGGLFEKQDKDYREKYDELMREQREEIAPLYGSNIELYRTRLNDWSQRLEDLCKD